MSEGASLPLRYMHRDAIELGNTLITATLSSHQGRPEWLEEGTLVSPNLHQLTSGQTREWFEEGTLVSPNLHQTSSYTEETYNLK